jgi:ribosomal peptide maturation radical SAM protein 1
MKYLKELFPRIASEGPKLTMFFEVKSNLKADHLKMLSAAGAKKIQPGIETLSSEILEFMKKGCTKLQNIQILKLAAEAGIYVEWNFLYGFPKERNEHYTAISELIPRLYHLQAPGGWGRVRADRFSPYFSTPEKFGIEIKPARAYSHIYGDDATSIVQLAYHFDIFSDELLATSSRVAAVLDLCRTWRGNETAQLYCEEAGERLIISDTRSSADAETTILTGVDASIYRLGWKITPVQELLRGLGPIFGRAAVLESVASLARRGLLIEEAGNVLTLALRQPGFRRAPSWEEIRADRLVPFLLRPVGMLATPAPMRPAQLVTEYSYHA